jgi:hypothetical protein
MSRLIRKWLGKDPPDENPYGKEDYLTRLFYRTMEMRAQHNANMAMFARWAEEIKLSNIQAGWNKLLNTLPETMAYFLFVDSGIQQKIEYKEGMGGPGIRALKRLIENAKPFSPEHLTREEIADLFETPDMMIKEGFLDSGSFLSLQRLPLISDKYDAVRITYSPREKVDPKDAEEAAAMIGICGLPRKKRAVANISPDKQPIATLPFTGSMLVYDEDGCVQFVTDAYLEKKLQVSYMLSQPKGADKLVNLLRELELPYVQPAAVLE